MSIAAASKSSKNDFKKVSGFWTCQTYLENMSTVLESIKISFVALIGLQKLRFWKLLPTYLLELCWITFETLQGPAFRHRCRRTLPSFFSPDRWKIVSLPLYLRRSHRLVHHLEFLLCYEPVSIFVESLQRLRYYCD